MRVLGIETSCDETGVALYETGRGLLGHCLHSQIDLHAVYGGVVPELASRDHIRRLPLLLRGPVDGDALLSAIDLLAAGGADAPSTKEMPAEPIGDMPR